MYFEIMNLVLVALGIVALFFGVFALSNRPGKRISSRSERAHLEEHLQAAAVTEASATEAMTAATAAVEEMAAETNKLPRRFSIACPRA